MALPPSVAVLQNSLHLVRSNIDEQADLLSEAQNRIKTLLKQYKLQPNGDGAPAKRDDDANHLPPAAAAASVEHLRELLGCSVRSQSEQSAELAALRFELASARNTIAGVVTERDRVHASLTEARAKAEHLAEQVQQLQTVHAEQAAASKKRVSELEGTVAEMRLAEERRLSIEAALASEAPPASVAAVSIAPPAPAQLAPQGFTASSGGFEL